MEAIRSLPARNAHFSSLRGVKWRSNLQSTYKKDCRASLAMTGKNTCDDDDEKKPLRHFVPPPLAGEAIRVVTCEEQSDEAIYFFLYMFEIASLRSQ